jgi:uncharacterized protein (TIGR02598 family)
MDIMKILVLKSHKKKSAFSLIEVSMAMGIVATILMALLALLPYGMDNIRDAKNTQILSRIGNEIVSEIQAVDWGVGSDLNKLTSYNNKIRKYDAEGILISAESNSEADPIYLALIDINSNPSTLPGSTANKKFLRRVTIKVAYAPNESAVEWDSDRNPLPYKVFVTEVVMLARERVLSSN